MKHLAGAIYFISTVTVGFFYSIIRLVKYGGPMGSMSWRLREEILEENPELKKEKWVKRSEKIQNVLSWISIVIFGLLGLALLIGLL